MDLSLLRKRARREKRARRGPPEHRHSAQHINPHATVAQKVADEVIFRRFQGEGVQFF